MASETQSFLPAAAGNNQASEDNRLHWLFVTTLTVAIAMIMLLVGIGIGSATGLETEPTPVMDVVE